MADGGIREGIEGVGDLFKGGLAAVAQVMPLGEVVWVVVGNVDGAIALPDQHLLGQVNGNAGIALHQGGTQFGVAKEQQANLGQFEPRIGGIGAVVDGGKQADALIAQDLSEAFAGFCHAVGTGFDLESQGD